MSKTTLHAIAVDLGAESGRIMEGVFRAGRLQLRELHRFPNHTVSILGHQYWDVPFIWEQLKASLADYGRSPHHGELSIGVDTWGVDFSLLGRDGSLLGLPYSYRDPRTRGVVARFLRLMPRKRVYELTGIQFLPINTLYQLFAMKREQSPLLSIATDLLFMPDLFTWFLTGRKATEYTIATTSQLLDLRTKTWADSLFAAMGMSSRIMQRVTTPGSVLGKLRTDLQQETGLESCRVVATASHDTAAAVAAVPAEGDDWMYISSGTWSLVGVETARPNTSALALRHNFTNEGGVGGRFRLLRNVTGMWLLRRLADALGGGQIDYGALVKAAAAEPGLRRVIDPDAASSDPRSAFPPGTMAARARCVFDSLALKYRQVLEELRKVHAQPVNRIHIVGGGAQNRLLCQLTADATGLPVYAGPVEATAIGNALVQAMALGYLSSLEQLREVVRRSFPVQRYWPRPSARWDRAYERFRELADQRRGR